MGSVRLGGGLLFLLSILYAHGHYASVFARKATKANCTQNCKNDELRYFHVEQTRRTWDNASQSCNLYGSDKAPSYVASDQDITFFRYNRLKATITPSAKDLYWIGATSIFTPWFELLGCHVYMPIDNGYIRTLTSLSTIVGPVADCYLQCKSHFGVNETHCFCPEKLKLGLLNRTCKLNTSSHFQSDVIGINTPTNYFHQIAMYKTYYGSFNIKENSLHECLRINTADDVRTLPCDTADSTGRTWTKAITEGLSSNNGGSFQWISFLRRRIIRWTQRNVLGSNTSACVSVRELSNEQEYEIVLRPCYYKLPSICQKRDAQKGHQMMTSLPPTSLLMPSDRPDVSPRGSFREEAGVPGENPHITYFHSRGSHLGRNGCPRKMERVFSLTQNKFREFEVDEEELNTDDILRDILDLEKENTKKQPNFDLIIDVFSDISD